MINYQNSLITRTDQHNSLMISAGTFELYLPQKKSKSVAHGKLSKPTHNTRSSAQQIVDFYRNFRFVSSSKIFFEKQNLWHMTNYPNSRRTRTGKHNSFMIYAGTFYLYLPQFFENIKFRTHDKLSKFTYNTHWLAQQVDDFCRNFRVVSSSKICFEKA